jgi:hypothetical protein
MSGWQPEMQKVALTILTTAALMSASCGGGGSSGPVTAPTPVGQTQVPTVDVQGAGSSPTDTAPPALVRWDGNVSFDAQTGSNTMALELRQSAAQVTGQFLIYGPDGGAGPLVGTVSGNTLSFNFSIGNQGQGCGNTASGTATVDTSTITGTFSGKRCNGQSYTNGRFTVNLPYPYRSSPYPIGGNWTMSIPASAGGGRWNFTISETTVDVTSGSVSGSVAVVSSSLSLGAGTLSGPVSSTFPGPTTNVPMRVSFSGACASSFTLGLGINGSNPVFYGGSFMGGSIAGQTCNGAVPQTNINLVRQ